MDTKHFKGNFPESCMVEGALLPADIGSKEVMGMQETVEWRVLLPRTKLGPDKCVLLEYMCVGGDAEEKVVRTSCMPHRPPLITHGLKLQAALLRGGQGRDGQRGAGVAP